MSEQQTTEVAEQPKQAVSTNKVTDYSLGIFGTSDNFIMAMQMAKALAESDIIPQSFRGKPSNCLVAIEQAQRLNASPFLVMQNLYVIQGKPSWSSSYLIAMINQSGKYELPLQFEEVKDKNGKPFSCKAWTIEKGNRVEGMTVDMDMAKAEGWLGKNGSKWQTMPQLMLRYRAASFFARLNCPEVTLGLYTREEVIEMPPEEKYVDVVDLSNPFANAPQFQKPEEITQKFEEPVNPFANKTAQKQAKPVFEESEQVSMFVGDMNGTEQR